MAPDTSSGGPLPPLDPPTFTALPADFDTNRSNYEVWAVRMPVDFDPSGMDGTEIMLTQPNDNYADEGGIKSGIQVGDVASSTFAVPAKKKKTTEADEGGARTKGDEDGERYCLMLGHPLESAAYRILVASAEGRGNGAGRMKVGSDSGKGSASDSDSSGSGGSSSSDGNLTDDDGESRNAQGSMRPLPTIFNRSYKVVQVSGTYGGSIRDTDIAPSRERAPRPPASAPRPPAPSAWGGMTTKWNLKTSKFISSAAKVGREQRSLHRSRITAK